MSQAPVLKPVAVVLLALACGAGEGALPDAGTDLEGTPCAAKGASDCIFTTLPLRETCEAGVLSDEWQARALAEVNRIRGRIGLPEVTYDASANTALQTCTLINTGLPATTPDLPASAECYSAVAQSGCTGANLTTFRLGIAAASPTVVHRALRDPETIVRSWLTNETEDGNLGHRRWLLDPFLGPVTFGMSFEAQTEGEVTEIRQVAGLRVMGPVRGDPSEMKEDFVAYPVGDTPESAVRPEWYLSFAVISDRVDAAANAAVSFEGARIVVTREGQPVPLATLGDGQPDQRHASGGKGPVYGLANHLQWRLVDPIATGSEYTVEIREVDVGGDARSYEYTFRVVPE